MGTEELIQIIMRLYRSNKSVEKEIFAEELYQRFCLDIKECRCHFEMKEVKRQVVMLVFDKIEKDGTEEF